MKKVYVIGAGFAGLTVAMRLAEQGFAVEIFEKSSRVGGLLGTDRTPYGIAEQAANALINTEMSHKLFVDLGLTPSESLKSSQRRYLLRRRPTQWPLNFLETVGFILKVFKIAVRGKKILAPLKNETLLTWGQKHLGKPATSYILEPAMQGIYGNEISGLSARLIIGPVLTKKKSRAKYKGLLTSAGGMQDLIEKLELKCRSLGVQFHLNTLADLEKLDAPVVIATSVGAATSLLEKSTPTSSSALKNVSMSSIMSVTLFLKDAQRKYRGFGCLFPRNQNLKTLGVLMNSYIFRDRNKTYSETWMIGGKANESLLDLSDSQIIELLRKEREQVFSDKSEILEYRINRWKNALPYYDIELEKALDTISSLTIPQNIYLHGNYLSGIGLSKILERSEFIAREIKQNYG